MQTIGQRLKAEREEQRLTLEKVFEATRIRVQYLEALEADDLSVMPSPVQGRGYLRNYAEFLGFDVEHMLRELREQNARPSTGEVIGPADSPFLFQTEGQKVDPQPAAPVLQAPDVAQQKPAEESTIPIKVNSARRKKADGSTGESQLATAEPPTRRRGRRRVEAEVPSSAEVQPGSQISMEPAIATGEALSPPEIAEETPAHVEAGDQPESMSAEGIETPVEEPPTADVSDSLWQSWLNRVGAMVAARGRRRTLTPKEIPPLENEVLAVPQEIGVFSEPEMQDRPPEESKQILRELGMELRQRRELLSLHFDEVERNTHVKAHYLDALERGALDELPSTVQTRGMLSNYATFLDLDVDALLLRFADALQARYRERNPHKPVRKSGQPILANIPLVRTFIAGDMIFGVGMAILLVGFAIWGVNWVMTIQSQQEIEPTSPSISEVLLSYPNPSSFTSTPTFLPAIESFPGEATVTVEIPTQNVNAEVQLNLVAVERTYMRVSVDGEVAFNGRVVPGNAYPFEAENQIEVLVGSGAAIRIVYNGRDLGLMGTFGQVINNIYLGNEIITPTALPSQTPTVTLTPTQTAPPTATLRFTETPTPTATAVP
jgi:cytoskeletal protein RodZ